MLQFAVVLVIGVFLRLPGLGDALDHDEAYTWEAFASHSVSTIATHYPVPNNHIFHTFLVKASAAVFGANEVGMRLPALLAGVLTIVATWWLARACGNLFLPAIGWMPVLAAVVVALSPAHIAWSQAARGYTLITLFSAVAGGALVRAQLARKRVWWPLYGVVLFLAMYTQPSAALLAVGLAGWSFLQAARSGDRPLLTATLAVHGAVIVALLAAYGPIMDRVLDAGRAWGLDLHGGSFIAFGRLLFDVAVQPGVVVLLLAVLGILWLRQHAIQMFGLLVALPAAAFVVPLIHGIAPQPRGYLFLLPWFATAAAIGVAAIPAGRRRQGSVALLVLSLGGLSGFAAATHETFPGWRDLGTRLASRTPRGELIVAPFRLDVEVQYYARAAIQRGIVTTLMDGAARSLLFATDAPRYALADYAMSNVDGEIQHLRLPENAVEKVYDSGTRAVYQLRAAGRSMMPDSWQWKAHPDEVAQIEFGVAGPAVSDRLGLAVRNDSGLPFRIFSAARFRPPGPGLCVLLSARSNLLSVVSLYQTGPGPLPEQIEEVTELSMLTTAARAVEGIGRDQHLWQMEACLWPVDAASEYGVFVRGSGAPRQDFCDIRVLYFPYP
ncbi:MAG: glycosyltransferase family 39 protein [bacterium]|nr:glycosyltransferase family 39 protein [bacterium]